MNYEYKVKAFLGRAKGAQGGEIVAQQLSELINSEAINGWELYQMSDVNIEYKPGCLGGLFGKKTISYIRYDQIIFRRAIENNVEENSN